MIRTVLDTNVLISGLLSALRPPGWIVDLAVGGEISLALDARIVDEYREVLRRPEQGLSRLRVQAILTAVERFGVEIAAPPLASRLPDIDDEPFLAVAAATRAVLVTGNLRHFPVRLRGAVEVETPRHFLAAWPTRSVV